MASVRKSSKRTRPEDPGAVIALPPTLSPDIAAEAARLVARTEMMGLVSFGADHAVDVSMLRSALDALIDAGIGKQLVEQSEVGTNLRGALEVLNSIVLHSPTPETEWGSVVDVLGKDLTMRLTGVTESSIRRYSTGDRTTPDDVAERLHFLAMVIADLLGAYNKLGSRRWFERPRRRLGAAPVEALGDGWSPDDDAAVLVAELARNLTSLGAT